MKKIEIAVSGPHEEEIGHMILSSIYGAVQNFGYTDVSVKADTIVDTGEVQVPEFLKKYRKGRMERELEAAGG